MIYCHILILISKLSDILCKVQTLNTLDDHEIAKITAHLKEELQQYLDYIDELLNSPIIVDIIRLVPLSSQWHMIMNSVARLPHSYLIDCDILQQGLFE
jgi:hypothetical protein